MMTETRTVIATVALILATGVGIVEMTRYPAQADGIVAGGAAGYAGNRVDAAFDVAATLPMLPAMTVAVAQKGDLPPLGCIGPFRAEVQAECLDSAAEIPSETYVTVETRHGATSVLTRTSGFQLAGF
jgi:hypothetical protein